MRPNQLLPIFFYKSHVWIILYKSQVYRIVIFIDPELLIISLKGKIFKCSSQFIGICHLLEVFEHGKTFKNLTF